MLLDRLCAKSSRPWRCLLAAVLVLVSLGLTSAQDEDDATIIDLSNPDLLYERTISVPRVPRLGVRVPNGTRITFAGKQSRNCYGGIVCVFFEDIPSNVSNRSLNMEARRGSTFVPITFSFDDTYTAGCKSYMFPVNATAADATDTLDPVTLTCDPVGVNVSLSNASITWQRFTNQIEMDTFIDSCTPDMDGCSENCTGSTAFIVENITGSIMLSEYNLTINNPLSNQAWFIPTFQRENCTYVAPPTFLYRWPRILTHYEFSLEVLERTMDYTDLSCEADSFPPTTTITWLRAGVGFNMSRYTFSNISSGEQLTINGGVTIREVMYEDSEEFTCVAGHAASMPSVVPDTSLTVRLRVRNRLRPLWPALGIVGVGIVVAVFIIIGHFVDKAIEKSQTDPINPAHHKRLQSITSTMLESENSSNNLVPGKNSSQAKSSGHGGHGAVKRLSSARLQLLEESQA